MAAPLTELWERCLTHSNRRRIFVHFQLVVSLSVIDLSRWYAYLCMLKAFEGVDLHLSAAKRVCNDDIYWPNLVSLTVRTSQKDSEHLARLVLTRVDTVENMHSFNSTYSFPSVLLSILSFDNGDASIIIMKGMESRNTRFCNWFQLSYTTKQRKDVTYAPCSRGISLAAWLLLSFFKTFVRERRIVCLCSFTYRQ